jgi:F-type H+-transporting ATPase subunit gamma
MAGGKERELRRRIRSVQSTKKITRAMELIAASRIAKAQLAIAAARPYVAQIRAVVRDLADTPDGRSHQLFREPEVVRRAAVIVISGDRGLSGAYNSSVIRATERLVRRHAQDGHEVLLFTVGRKAQSYFRYRGQPVASAFTAMSDRPTYEDARRIVAAVVEPFVTGDVDQVELVFTEFLSLGSQQVRTRQLIPLPPDDGDEASSSAGAGPALGGGTPQVPGHHVEYEFEPEPAEILNRLLPSWLEAEVLAAMLESAASQHASQQRAMAAATENAEELVKTYTRAMNRVRQDSITNEIMEIVGGAEALRSAGVATDSSPFHETFELPAAESA